MSHFYDFIDQYASIETPNMYNSQLWHHLHIINTTNGFFVCA